jgi:hypothetical protein
MHHGRRSLFLLGRRRREEEQNPQFPVRRVGFSNGKKWVNIFQLKGRVSSVKEVYKTVSLDV